MAEGQFAPDQAIACLLDAGVEFVVIGGIAADVHGAGWSTFDLDVIVEVSDENLKRLAHALEALDAVYNLPDGRVIRPDEKRLQSIPGPQLFRTKFGRLDVLKEADGSTYESLLGDAVVVDRDGRALRFASVPALIRMKRAANRAKDAEGIVALEAVLEGRHDD